MFWNDLSTIFQTLLISNAFFVLPASCDPCQFLTLIMHYLLLKYFFLDIHNVYYFDFSSLQWPFMNLDHSVLLKLIQEQLYKGAKYRRSVIYSEVLLTQCHFIHIFWSSSALFPIFLQWWITAPCRMITGKTAGLLNWEVAPLKSETKIMTRTWLLDTLKADSR